MKRQHNNVIVGETFDNHISGKVYFEIINKNNNSFSYFTIQYFKL